MIIGILCYVLIGFIFVSILSYRGELRYHDLFVCLVEIIFWPIFLIDIVSDCVSKYFVWLEKKGKNR